MDHNRQRGSSRHFPVNAAGFTLIELMIVVAVIAIIMTLAIPTYSNYSIRSKLSSAIAQVDSAKSAVVTACLKDDKISSLSNSLAEYEFKPSKYVKNIVLGSSCSSPTITISTRATGAKPNPVLTMTGKPSDQAGQMTWTCVSSGLNIHVPDNCRS